EYKSLTKGFSYLFTSLFDKVEKLAKHKKIKFHYHPDTRLRSIIEHKNVIHYTTATRKNPDKKEDERTTHAAFLAMPRSAIELVAQATRYDDKSGNDVLNHEKVQLYLESVLIEPSYKIGMFFHEEWWKESGGAKYPAKLTSYFLTDHSADSLEGKGFTKNQIKELKADKNIIETSYDNEADFIDAVQSCLSTSLSYDQKNTISAAAELDTIGPSATDMPIRQVVYFGDNALKKSKKPVYGILASYDDIYYTTFWKSLELGTKGTRKIPESRDTQPLEGPRKATDVMVKMLRKQLAVLHYGPQADYTLVPEPLETRYMDWSLPPFNAGYHAYKSHYNMGDVQQMIRKPSQLVKGVDANIFIVGETYSNDQAWVEGAFCTSESVLNDFFGIKPIISEKHYPFICPK
ncbi:MAG: hypothetical protein HRT68_13445, partial [Flavobacteriaceae bacterium]|nr:hypothetical protein [Flavobacteriaceae bacterium]